MERGHRHGHWREGHITQIDGVAPLSSPYSPWKDGTIYRQKRRGGELVCAALQWRGRRGGGATPPLRRQGRGGVARFAGGGGRGEEGLHSSLVEREGRCGVGYGHRAATASDEGREVAEPASGKEIKSTQNRGVWLGVEKKGIHVRYRLVLILNANANSRTSQTTDIG